LGQQNHKATPSKDMATRYVHTNLIAKDWKRLLAFYQAVFGCMPVPPARDLSGDWLDQATGLTGAHIRGVHLRLPGYGDEMKAVVLSGRDWRLRD